MIVTLLLLPLAYCNWFQTLYDNEHLVQKHQGFPSGQRDLVLIPSYAAFVRYKDDCVHKPCTAIYKMRLNAVALKYMDDGDNFLKAKAVFKRLNSSQPDDYLPPLASEPQYNQFQYYFSTPLQGETVTLKFDNQTVKFLSFQEVKRSGKLVNYTSSEIVGLTDTDGFFEIIGLVELNESVTVLNFTGQIWDVPDKEQNLFVASQFGFSGVFDIDETLRKFGGNLDQVVKSIFFTKYVDIPGVVDQVNTWYKDAMPRPGDKFGAPFYYYISACPWQMAVSITDFLKRVGLPLGPVEVTKLHLLSYQPYQIATNLRFRSARKIKYDALMEAVLPDMPNRTYILSGDNVMQDPEMQNDILKEGTYTDRIKKVVVRKAPREVLSWYRRQNRKNRYKNVMQPEKWLIYEDPQDLATIDVRTIMLQDNATSLILN